MGERRFEDEKDKEGIMYIDRWKEMERKLKEERVITGRK